MGNQVSNVEEDDFVQVIGVVFTDAEDIECVHKLVRKGRPTVAVYNNEPYGLVEIDGIQKFEFATVENREQIQELAKIALSKDRGCPKIVMLLADKKRALVISDPREEETSIIYLDPLNSDIEKLGYAVDVIDVEEDDPDYLDFAEILGVDLDL